MSATQQMNVLIIKRDRKETDNRLVFCWRNLPFLPFQSIISKWLANSIPSLL